MNVVYDLRYATDHFPGIGTHAHALLRALVSAPSGPRFRVLWRPADLATRFEPAWFARQPRVDWIETREPALGFKAPFATGSLLRRLGGDVYLSPFYLKPVGAPMPVVLTLPDAMHLAAETEPSWGLRTRFALALRLARGADAAITPSAFSRGELIRRAGFPRERLHVVPQGTPPLSPPCVERPAAIPERPFALVVGANRVHKNHRLLAQVWQLLGAPPALDLVAVGALDPRFPSLDALARETGARGVHVLGAVSPGTLAWAYTHATLLVFPSRYEGFGFPLLEAAAYGTPVLASDIPALRELGEGVARFVPANEPSANDATVWARAIADLAADDAARARMRDAGRDLAARHDYATVAARTLALLESVVGTRPR